MEVEQYALYLCLSGWQKQEESCFRKAMKLYPNALLFSSMAHGWLKKAIMSKLGTAGSCLCAGITGM